MHSPETISGLSEQDLDLYGRLREDVVRASLETTALIRVRGTDRRGWLQGQTTNDIRNLSPGASMALCFCSPTGQVLADCAAWEEGDDILLATDQERAPVVLERFESMVILEDVEAELLTPSWRGLSLQGPASTEVLHEMVEPPKLDIGWVNYGSAAWLCLRSNRTGDGGWDLWAQDAAAWSVLADAFREIAEISPRVWEIARLESGYPEWGIEWNERTLPPELGPDFAERRISYTKGCYTGQEVLHRIYSRGHTNKTWRALLAESPLRAGATVTLGGREVGVVSRAVVSPEFGPIGGAMLRNEAAQPGTTVTVDGIAAEVRPMPLLRGLG